MLPLVNADCELWAFHCLSLGQIAHATIESLLWHPGWMADVDICTQTMTLVDSDWCCCYLDSHPYWFFAFSTFELNSDSVFIFYNSLGFLAICKSVTTQFFNHFVHFYWVVSFSAFAVYVFVISSYCLSAVKVGLSASMSTGCVAPLKRDWAIFCLAGSAWAGRVLSAIDVL